MRGMCAEKKKIKTRSRVLVHLWASRIDYAENIGNLKKRTFNKLRLALYNEIMIPAPSTQWVYRINGMITEEVVVVVALVQWNIGL